MKMPLQLSLLCCVSEVHNRRRIAKHPTKLDVMGDLDLFIFILFWICFHFCILNAGSHFACRLSAWSLICFSVTLQMSPLLSPIDLDSKLQFSQLEVSGSHEETITETLISVLNSLSTNFEDLKRIFKWRSLQCVTAD